MQIFVGTHDFRSFSTGDDRGDDTIRTIQSLSLQKIPEQNAFRVEVVGQKFLRYMVRRVVGAAVDVACHDNKSIDLLHKALQDKNPHQNLINAPAQGLTLHSITYKNKGIFL